MPASPNDPRTKRRKAAGDDPNKMSMAPQPVPGAPQGQGNMMNYPMMQTPSGEMGQQIGAGSYQFPYGDLGEGVGDALTPPFVKGNTPTPQSIVPGTGMNGPYNAMAQPDKVQMEQIGAAYEINAAGGSNVPNGLNNGLPVSYQISPMGPVGGADPAMLPPQLGYEGPGSLPMSGGMSTGRGGGRNKGKGKK